MTHHEMMQMIARKANEIQSQPAFDRAGGFVESTDFDEQFLAPEPFRPIGEEAISDDMFVTAAEWRGE